MNNDFLGKEDLSILEKALKLGLDFKVSDKDVVKYKTQEDIMKELLEPLPLESKDLNSLLDECKNKVVDGAVNFSSPNFMAFPDAGNSTAAMCGHILTGMLNQNLINSMHCSPTATFVEMAVLNWLREILGYKPVQNPQESMDIGGINVSGGTMANTVAVLLAREKAVPNIMDQGVYDSKKLKMFIPRGIGHYTSKAAMSWIGLGKENIVEVETTSNFTLDQKDLVRKIEQCLSEGSIPFIVIAYAGDSRTMAIDDFNSLSKITSKYNIWFHIDACHGASLCFSDKLKYKVKDINLADSITIDPHKVLLVPYPCSYLLVKDPNNFKSVSGVSDLITKEKYSFGQITPFAGSRAFNSLKLWFLIKNLGIKKIGKIVEDRHELVKYFESKVKETKNFYLINKVIINSSVYIYVPNSLRLELGKGGDISRVIDKINELNLDIQKRMFKEGKFYVHTFKINDFNNVLGCGKDSTFQVMRLMLGNPLIKTTDLDNLISYTEKVAVEESRRRGYE